MGKPKPRAARGGGLPPRCRRFPASDGAPRGLEVEARGEPQAAPGPVKMSVRLAKLPCAGERGRGARDGQGRPSLN